MLRMNFISGKVEEILTKLLFSLDNSEMPIRIRLNRVIMKERSMQRISTVLIILMVNIMSIHFSMEYPMCL